MRTRSQVVQAALLLACAALQAQTPNVIVWGDQPRRFYRVFEQFPGREAK